MKVAVIDYGSGNLRSCAKAFERASRDAALECEVVISADVDEIAAAARIVLPGVGAFADCRAGLNGVPGLVETLNREVIENAKPFFGICVGMQLMADIGREFGDTPGLGWIGGEVTASTHISCTHINLSPPVTPRLLPASITAGRSQPWWQGTTWSAPSSTRKKARASGRK